MERLTFLDIVAARDVTYAKLTREARQVRVTPRHYEALLSAAQDLGNVLSNPTPPATPLFGLAVKVDRYLPAGVWRLCDEYGRLLHDPRSGKKGAEW